MKKVNINRERVLELIKSAPIALSTKEMARILRVKERSVRAAIIWLKIGGFIKQEGFIMSQTTPGPYGKRKYKIDLYVWTGRKEAICQIHTKDLTEVNKELVNKNYGDVGLLQSLMMGMRSVA